MFWWFGLPFQRYKDVIVTCTVESPAAENVLPVLQPMTSMGVAHLDVIVSTFIAMQKEW